MSLSKHLLSDVLARPKCSCDTDPPGEAGSAEIGTITWKGGRFILWMGKTGSRGSNGKLENGGQFKASLFLVHNKTEAEGNLLVCVIQQVEPQAHAGEKTTFDSFSDHIAILQSACVFRHYGKGAFAFQLRLRGSRHFHLWGESGSLFSSGPSLYAKLTCFWLQYVHRTNVRLVLFFSSNSLQ